MSESYSGLLVGEVTSPSEDRDAQRLSWNRCKVSG